MSALFVALGIMVLALLALLLWFVPHLLQQQATKVAVETSQLREMLLDLLSEQEAVTMRQTQLGSSLGHLQDQLTIIAETGVGMVSRPQITAEANTQQLESRLTEIQNQIQGLDRAGATCIASARGAGQRVVGQPDELARHHPGSGGDALAGSRQRAGRAQARELLEELEQEMQNLRSISEEIAMLQWRLRRSLHERQSNLSVLRAHTGNGAS